MFCFGYFALGNYDESWQQTARNSLVTIPLGSILMGFDRHLKGGKF